MSYIADSLGRSETLLYRARFPFVYHVGSWALLAASVLGGIVAFANGYPMPGAAVLLAGATVFLAILIPIWTTEIAVTNQRFIFKRGLLWRTTQELQLRAVEEVNLEQGLPGRILNFGRLVIRGTGVDDIHLPALADPLGLRKALQDGMAAAARTAAPPPEAAARRSVA
jgi:uncharacterized membrane protein YdbT with pleckstrin-like domain